MVNLFTAFVLVATFLWAIPVAAQAIPGGQRGDASSPVTGGPLTRAAEASAAQIRLAPPTGRLSRSRSGGEKILLGAGIGAAVLAAPVAIWMQQYGAVDGRVVATAGLTGAVMGAAMAYKLLR